MFTGLVEAVGELLDRQPIEQGARLRIRVPFANELSPGDSMAVNGVCLTVTDKDGGDVVRADAGPETLRVTTLGGLARGAALNLERPLRADGRLGGHFVQGHVDGIGEVGSFRPAADFSWMTVAFPRALAPLIVPKGSIAVDGISLTVAALHGDRFDIMVVPFTLEHTNLSRIAVPGPVNLECDVIGKYVARALEVRGIESGTGT
jgi:riboflavin synthase